MKPKPMISGSGLAAILLACGTLPAAAIEVAGSLLIDLDANDFTTGATTWQQKPGTGLPGNFIPTGTPTRQNLAGAPAIIFDGKAEYFTGPFTNGTSLEANGGPYTVEVWACQGNVRWEECLVSWSRRGGPNETFAGFRYGLNPDWGAWAGWGGAGDMGFAPAIGDEGSPPGTGAWHLLTYTYDGGTKRVYVDGVLNVEEPASLDAKDGNTVLIGTEREGDGNITGNDQIFFSGGIARIRIHSGTLSDVQVTSNYNEEAASFPGLTASTDIPFGPIHRWSFNDPAGPVADGSVFSDSVGAAQAMVQGGAAYGGTDASLTSTALALPGGGSNVAPYLDLPNGIISKNSAITIEFWTTPRANLNWSRLLSLGFSNSTGGVEIAGPGGTYTGKVGLWLTSNMGGGTDQEFNRGGGTSPNGGLQRATIRSTVLDAETHHAVVYDPVLQEWRWYRDAQLVAVIPDTVGPAGINDIDNWFGRSGWNGDQNYQGDLNELRIFNYALTEPQVYRNFLDGPDTITAAVSGGSFTWTPTGAGPFNFNNAGNEDNWSTGPGGRFPNAIDDTANLVSNLIADQDVHLNVGVTVGTLNIGDTDASHAHTISPGTAGSLTMQASVGNAAINQTSTGWDTIITAPLILNSDTVVSNPSIGWVYLAGSISGSGNLIKSGASNVFITGESPAFGGDVEVLGGTLSLGDNTTTGSISATSFIPTFPGRIAVSRSDDVTIAPVVTGTGSIEHRGSGRLTLGSGTSLAHTWDFDAIAGSGDLILEGDASVDGPRNFRIENNTILRGDCDVRINQWFSVGIGGGGVCTMQDNAALTANGDFNVGDVGSGPSMFKLEGGSVNCGNYFVGKNPGTSGVLIQTGGTIDKNGGGEARIGGAVGVYGAHYLRGGTLDNNASNFQIGSAGYGILEISGGASATLNGWTAVGRFESDLDEESIGLLDIRDGLLTANGTGGAIFAAEEGIGVINVHAGGALVAEKALRIGGGFDGKGGTGTVNLLGGSITTNNIDQTNNDQADGTLNLDGGSIIARQASTTFLEGIDRAYIRAGGVTIDSAGHDITIAQPLLAPGGDGVAAIAVSDPGVDYEGAPLIQLEGGDGTGATASAILDGSGGIASIEITNPGTNYTVAPVVSIYGGGIGFGLATGPVTLAANSSGGLTKTGLGTLYLDGANTYTGDTTVDDGTLGGSGSIAGGLVVGTGTALAPGNSVGTFAVGGDTTINGTYECEIDGATADRLDVTGTLDITTATLNITELAAATEPFYIIASYDSLTGAGFQAPIGGLPAGYTIDYNYGGTNQIALVSGAIPDYDTWVASFAGFVDTALGSDPDRDGLDNEAEYAFGLDPTSGVSSTPLDTGVSAAGQFTYTRRDPALTGLAFTYEWSTSLAPGSWTNVVPAAADAVTPIGGTDNQSVTVDLSGQIPDLLANATLFVRVKAQ